MKLQGEAKLLLFRRYAKKKSMSYEKLLRFAFMSRSNARVVRNFLNGSTIEFRIKKLGIELEGFNGFRDIPDKTLIALLKLLHPKQLKLNLINFSDRVRFQSFLPYLDGVTKLKLYSVSFGDIECLRTMFPQLKELECNFNCLTLPNLPILRLNKLIIHGVSPYDKYDMSYILRHDIKVLDLEISYINESPINGSRVGKASIEHLILDVDYSQISKLSPLIINFCEHLPKLKKVHVKINDVHSERIPLFETKFASMCDQVILSKDRVKKMLSELTVDLSYDIVAYKKDTNYEENRELILSKAEQFGNVHINKAYYGETIVVDHMENHDGMKFTFKPKVTLRIR